MSAWSIRSSQHCTLASWDSRFQFSSQTDVFCGSSAVSCADLASSYLPQRFCYLARPKILLLNSILYAGSFSSSAVFSDESDPSSNVPHPEIPGSDIPSGQTAHATGSHRPGGWDPPEIPGSMHDHPRPSKHHPSEHSSSSSLPEDDEGPDKLQRNRGTYVSAQPPQTEDPIPARGPAEPPLQEAFESDSLVTNPCFCHSRNWDALLMCWSCRLQASASSDYLALRKALFGFLVHFTFHIPHRRQ